MDQGMLLQRLQAVRERIKAAAESSGREAAGIQLIAVSKSQPVEKIAFFKEQGVNIFGENRVQELLEKDEEITGVPWHFIGHLQRNKVKYLLRMNNCQLIHSLDSWRLAREVEKRARKNDRIMPVLIEVNTSGEDSKYGMEPEGLMDFMARMKELKSIRVRGLMTIAPYARDPEESRPYFQTLFRLKERLNTAGYGLSELSMGMSNDFEIGIEEGATMVRIGTALFGERGEE